MHHNRILLLLLLCCFASRSSHAQAGGAYFTVPVTDSGDHFSESQFQGILSTGSGYVSLGLCKTISLSQMCAGIVAAFRDSEGSLLSYHRYFDCDSVAGVAGASGLVTPDNHLLMAYMATEPLYPTGQGDLYLYLVKASISDPSVYTTHRVVIKDGYNGAPFDLVRSSTRIIRHTDGSFWVLVPAIDRMNLCHLDSNLQVLSTREIRIPDGQGGPYKRQFGVGFSGICALPSGDVLTTCAYQVVDSNTLQPVGSGTVINRFTNNGQALYTRVYETSPVSSSGFISTTSQLYALSEARVVGVGIAGSSALYAIDPATGLVSNGRYIQPPAPVSNDSNNYSENLGIVRSGDHFLTYRIVKNYSLDLPSDQVGIIKTDTNLNLLASRKLSYRGIQTLFPDNGTTACLRNDGSGMMLSLNAWGYGKDSSVQESGEAIISVAATDLNSDCAEGYSIPDQLVPMADPTPASLTVAVVASSDYESTLRTNIQHDLSTALYQRNLCLEIPAYQPTGIPGAAPVVALRLYPNPTTGLVHVASSQPIRSVEVLTLTGVRALSTSTTGHSEIDCSMLTPGLYLVRVTLSNGRTVLQKLSRL